MNGHLDLLRGAARENDALDEARADRHCSMGVGCGTAGACYAKAHGRPEECPCAPPLPNCPECRGTGERDSGGTHPWGWAIYLPCDCRRGSDPADFDLLDGSAA